MHDKSLVESFWPIAESLVGSDVLTLDRSKPNRVEAVSAEGVWIRTQKGNQAELIRREWVNGLLSLLEREESVAVSDLRERIGTGRFRSSALFALVHAAFKSETQVTLNPLRVRMSNTRTAQELLFIRRWWQGRADERFWVETTEREDLGVDLNAPLRNEIGRPEWSYELILHVEPGDIVFHCAPPAPNEPKSLLAWSRAVGAPWEDRVRWVSHRSATRARVGSTPYLRPGRRLGLEGPFALARAIEMNDLQEKVAALRLIRDSLGEPSYFPFELSARRPVRPLPAYLFQAPRRGGGAV